MSGKSVLLSIIFMGTVTCLSYLVTSIFIKGNVLHRIDVLMKDVKSNRTKEMRYQYEWMNKLNTRYIEKTNLKRYIPFIDLTWLLVLETVIPVTIFVFTFIKTGSVLSALPLSMFAAVIPLLLLDFLAGYNVEKTQNDLASFISVLARWCSVKNDIFYAFEKSLESGLNEPLNTFVRDLTVQIKCGINPSDALDHFSNRLGDSEFKDAILNIKQNVKFRGDGNALLANMESRLYRMQEERNKRKISTLGDRTMILCTIIAVLGLAIYFLKSNEKIASFYFQETSGKILLFALCLLFILGIVLFMNVTKVKE